MELGDKFQKALNELYANRDYRPILETINGEGREMAEKLIKQATLFTDIVSIDSGYIVDFGVGIPVKFIPDLLLKDTVIENKYTSGYYSAKTVQTQRQGTVYYYGVKMLKNYFPKIIYQLFNNKTGKAQLVPVEKNIEDVADMLQWMLSTLGRIKKSYDTGGWSGHHGKFDCNLGKACPIKYRIMNYEH